MKEDIENLIKKYLQGKGYWVRQVSFEFGDTFSEQPILEIREKLFIRAKKNDK